MKRIIPLIIFSLLLVMSYTMIFQIIYFDMYGEGIRDIIIIGAITDTIIVAFFVVIALSHKYKEKIRTLQSRLARWSKLSPRVNQIGDDAFHELPIGIIVLDDESSEIKWVNQYAKLIFDDKLVDTPIATISNELDTFILSGQLKTVITVKEEKYEVIYRSEFEVLYLFNVTERENAKLEYELRLPALGIFILDNFEENLSEFDMSEQSSIKGEYLSTIADWVEDYEGYLKLYGESRMIMLAERKKLMEMMHSKFDILEKIRNISQKHGIRVTLSIGVASWDIAYNELSIYAQNAIELAEKRGGDQAVVNIQNQKISYFGAKLDATSKNSRVNVKQFATTLRDLFDEVDQVFIMGHTQTDLDSFGSMIAVQKMAQTNPLLESYLVLDKEKMDESVRDIYQILEEQKHRILDDVITTSKALEKLTKESLVIVLDTQSPMIVHSPELLESEAKVAIIDHHRSNEQSIQSSFSYIDAAASSTIELIIELVSFFNREIDVDDMEACIMYAGLIVDTNTFTYRTSAKTFEIAAKLKEYGANTILVKQWLRNDLEKTTQINDLISQAEVFLDRFVIVKSEETYQDRSFLAQVSQNLLDIRGVEAAFTIVNLGDDTVGVSARSFGDLNVQVIMEEMGGGGHLNSAATQIKDLKVTDVYEQLKHILELEYGGGGEPMKVILLEDVKGKGKKDDIIDVANGYGQFLINSKSAIVANDENLKKLSQTQEQAKQEELKYLNLMKKLAGEIEGKKITLSLQVGVDGKKFGSVTTAKIAEEFEKVYGVTIDKKKLEISSEINSAGIYTVSVNLHKQVKAQFEVNIEEKR